MEVINMTIKDELREQFNFF